MRSLYVHIPFCKAKCAYCDFCSGSYSKEIQDKYIKALTKEVYLSSFNFRGKIDTLYVGGGTPSLLADGKLSVIADTVKRYYGSAIKEFTVEANPESLTRKKLDEYAEAGVTRISLGVQSLDDSVLKKIGRIHSAQQAVSAMQAATEYGFDLSADLMLGLPGEDSAGVIESLETISGIGAEHISAYMLKLEEGTRLFAEKPVLPDDDSVADLYLSAVQKLKALGFERYEVSNFAKHGKISLHNYGYWTDSEYLGLGLAAHGFYNGKRFENIADIGGYFDALDINKLPVAAINAISREERDFERIMLGLRLDEGADRKFFAAFEEKLKKLERFLNVNKECVKIKPEYVLVLNQILAEFLA